MTESEKPMVEVNGRRYAWPKQPLVIVCIDGSEPDYEGSDGGGYMERAAQAGVMPWYSKVRKSGLSTVADCVVPTFTNPNNLSIVTGAPPSVHGICGNFFYDTKSDAEVMMNDPALLRTETIFSAFQKAGARITVITAKDKLRGLLGNGLEIAPDKAVCFSAEKAEQATVADNGIDQVLELVGLPLPSVYSADLSEFVFAAGVKLMERDRPDIMYLSTTDYIQHKHAPGTEVANRFYAMMDSYWAKLEAMGATVALTADHGMKAKHDQTGEPDVIYLQSLLDEWLGQGNSRVILPITDPYVVHHGALGGYATAYLSELGKVQEVIDRLNAFEGVECALTKSTACQRFELPEDRVGDVVVVAKGNKVLGTAPENHDVSGLTEPLRSHGSIAEQKVPFCISRPVNELPTDRPLRNFDIMEVALNRT